MRVGTNPARHWVCAKRQRHDRNDGLFISGRGDLISEVSSLSSLRLTLLGVAKSNAPSHRLPPQPKLFRFSRNRKRAAIGAMGQLGSPHVSACTRLSLLDKSSSQCTRYSLVHDINSRVNRSGFQISSASLR